MMMFSWQMEEGKMASYINIERWLQDGKRYHQLALAGANPIASY